MKSLVLLLLLCSTAPAQTFYKVRSVHDGDSLRLVGIKRAVRVLGIDAPEIASSFGRQVDPYGQAARMTLLEILGCTPAPTPKDKEAVECARAVRLGFEPKSRVDRCNDRVLHYMWTEAGVNVSLAMVEAGAARYEPRFRTRFKAKLIAAEDRARKERKGVWKDAE